MKTVSVLIVDDQSAVDDSSKRREHYELLEKRFNAYPHRAFDISISCLSRSVEAICSLRKARGLFIVGLDMMLVGWNAAQQQGLRACLIELKPPTFAISAHFSNPDATSVYTSWVRDLGKHMPLLHFHTIVTSPDAPKEQWDTILDQVNTILTTELQLSVVPSIGDDEPIAITHITDVHIKEKSDREDVDRVASQLMQRGLVADFLAVTGDVVDKGGLGVDRSPLNNAEGWLSAALRGGWLKAGAPVGTPNPRVLLVPGNHDFRQTLAAGAFVKRATAKDASPAFVFADTSTNDVESTWKFGLGPFLRFHENITGSRYQHGDLPGYRLDARFSPLGIFFLEIWIQSFEIGSYGSRLTNEETSDALSTALNQTNSVTATGDCVVVLLHALDIQNRPTDSIEDRIYKTLGSLRSDLRTIVLKGHYHNSFLCKHANNSSVFFVQSGSAEGKQRVVSSIRLIRQKSKVTGFAVERIVHTEASGWLHITPPTRAGGGMVSWTDEGWVG